MECYISKSQDIDKTVHLRNCSSLPSFNKFPNDHIWRGDQDVRTAQASAHLRYLLTEPPRPKSDVFTQNPLGNQVHCYDFHSFRLHRPHSSICGVSITIPNHNRCSQLYLWKVWGLCVSQSCVWPTLPSHRTRVLVWTSQQSGNLGSATWGCATLFFT